MTLGREPPRGIGLKQVPRLVPGIKMVAIHELQRRHQGVSHLDAPEEYERLSPVRFVRDIDRPILIIHSEEDWRCPIAQAEELWVARRLLGKEVDFYRFPGENHELSRTGSPIHRVQRAEIILDWFADKLSITPGA